MTDLLYVTVPASESTTAVFTLPDMTFVREFIAGSVALGDEPNIALLHLPGGQPRAYVSADVIVYIHDAATGDALGSFAPERGLETIVGDDFYQALYIPDENESDGGLCLRPRRQSVSAPGDQPVSARGFWIPTAKASRSTPVLRTESRTTATAGSSVSDQRSSQTEFEFFDRMTWRHLGTLLLDDVNNTDGIASTQRPLPGLPAWDLRRDRRRHERRRYWLGPHPRCDRSGLWDTSVSSNRVVSPLRWERCDSPNLLSAGGRHRS